MPHLRIETNVPAAKISPTLLTELISVVAKTTGKPGSVCAVTIVPNQIMSFGGTQEPCGIVNLMWIGHSGPKENAAHSKALGEKISAGLGIPIDRMYITFQAEPSVNVGCNGTTIYEIKGLMV